MKTCRTCGVENKIEEFYVHSEMADGHLNICKDCIKNNVRTRREMFPEKVRAYDMSRANKPNRVKTKREVSARRRREVAGYSAAHNAVTRAVKAGALLKEETCGLCGSGGRLEAHHCDYSKKLDVVWLCIACHRRLHMGKTETAIKIQSTIAMA